MSNVYSQISSKFYYSDSVELIIGKEITSEEAKEFFDKYSNAYNDNYTNILKADKSYFIELDNQDYILIAVYKSGDIRLYNKDEIEIIIKHKMDNKPFSNEFISEVPNLIKELAVKLNIDYLGITTESVNLLDLAYKKMVNENQVEKKDFFLLLLAYIGEVIKYRQNGEWEVKNINGYQMLYIIDEKGRKYCPHNYLIQLFDRVGLDVSIEDIIEAELKYTT